MHYITRRRLRCLLQTRAKILSVSITTVGPGQQPLPCNWTVRIITLLKIYLVLSLKSVHVI